MTNKRRILTIAGLDVSGGAGINADLSTFHEFNSYGQAVLTAIVAMEPETWNHLVFPVPMEQIKLQIETALASDLPLTAIKTGMLGTVEMVQLARDVIDKSDCACIVIDPVLVCKGTDEVLNPQTAKALRDELMPRSTIITPNLFEAGQMAGFDHTPQTKEEVEAAAKAMVERGAKNVAIKGSRGLSSEKAIDLFYDGKEMVWLEAEKIHDPATHGAGCTFAAAITAGLAMGLTPLESVKLAKDYVHKAIEHGFAYNKFVSPVYRPGYREA